MSAAAFPDWVMLERFVFRREDKESFPDDSKAPIIASGVTCSGAEFRIAFSLAKPPLISRLYAQLPTFPPPNKQQPLAVLTSHRHLVLLRVGTKNQARGSVLVQDFFIFNASSTDNPSRLKALPPCTVPLMPLTLRYPRCSPAEENKRRLLAVRSMGLVSRGEEFAVAELKLFNPNDSKKVYADICLLRSSCPSSSSDVLGGQWNNMRRRIKLLDQKPDDPWQLVLWQTDTVIPFNDCLCWVDYFRGILFCDVFGEPIPTVSFLRFPLARFPDTPMRSDTRSWFYRGVTAINQDRALRFVDVARNDGVAFGALKPGASFTITCHTLEYNTKVWVKDYELTSTQLWSANPDLPCDILMLPQTDIAKPHIVHFLFVEFGRYWLMKMWLVAIDMSTNSVKSFHPYINGVEDHGTEDFDLTKRKSQSTLSFLPCEFSRFLHTSRKREDMECVGSSCPTD